MKVFSEKRTGETTLSRLPLLNSVQYDRKQELTLNKEKRELKEKKKLNAFNFKSSLNC